MPAGAAFCPACGSTFTGEGSAPAAMLYAGFWMRFLASIIDGIIMGVVGTPVMLLVDSVPLSILLRTVIGAVYTIGFWISYGATPGKMAMSVEIVMADGRPLAGEAAILRYVGYYINVLTLGIGYLMIGFTPQKRGLHDYIAGTVAVRKG